MLEAGEEALLPMVLMSSFAPMKSILMNPWYLK